MKKLISLLTVIALITTLCCAAFAEEELYEYGLSDVDAYNYEVGNFEGVTYDGTVHAKIFVDYTWEVFDGVPEGVGFWTRENADWTDEDGDHTMTITATLTAAEDLHFNLEGSGYYYEDCLINGNKATVYYNDEKTIMGANYELAEGILNIEIIGITDEAMENEAVTVFSSLLTEE